MKIILQQQDLGFDILNYIQIVVKMTKVLNFENKKETFDQDKELNFSSKLFRYVLLMDGDNIVPLFATKLSQ
jgi:hypothetical protein